jgi:hypothetical protein
LLVHTQAGESSLKIESAYNFDSKVKFTYSGLLLRTQKLLDTISSGLNPKKSTVKNENSKNIASDLRVPQFPFAADPLDFLLRSKPIFKVPDQHKVFESDKYEFSYLDLNICDFFMKGFFTKQCKSLVSLKI